MAQPIIDTFKVKCYKIKCLLIIVLASMIHCSTMDNYSRAGCGHGDRHGVEGQS